MRWGALVCAVAACHGGSNNNNGGGARLKASLDLTHVIGFAIANPTSMRDCMPSTLYALQDNGDMVVTTVTEVPGMGDAGVQCTTTMQTEMAVAVFDTVKYDVITYQLPGLNNCPMAAGSAGCQPCPFVVLRKGDGALFCGEGGLDVRKVAGEGDVLYLGPDSLVRLDMTTDPPTSTTVDDGMQTGDHFNTFDVNAANDALAAGSFGARIFKASGGLQNITAQMESFQWLDPNGMFGYSVVNNGSGPLTLQTYRLAPGTYAQTLAGTVSMPGIPGFALATSTQVYGWTFVNGTVPTLVDLTPSAAGGVCNDPFNGVPIIACSDDTPCAGTCSGLPATCHGGPNDGLTCMNDAFCTYQCQLSGANHTITGGPAMIKAVVGTGTQMYVQGTDTAGNGSILGIDASMIQETACATGTGTGCMPGTCCSGAITPITLLAAGAYTVNALALSRAGELTFAGLRNSDGAHVVGNCAGGTCTVLNATAPVVSTLQRIN